MPPLGGAKGEEEKTSRTTTRTRTRTIEEGEDRLKAELHTRLRRTEVAATDRAIDGLVYELCGLTDDEIAIIEAACP